MRWCVKVKKKENEAIEANQKMDDIFNEPRSRNIIGNSAVETANLKIQEQFYENNEEENYSAPYHVDINNPPIKK